MFRLHISQKAVENDMRTQLYTQFLSIKSLCVCILTKRVDYLVRAGLGHSCSDRAEASLLVCGSLLIKALQSMNMLQLYLE